MTLKFFDVCDISPYAWGAKEITLALSLPFCRGVKMDGGKVRTLLDFCNTSSMLVVEISQKTAHMPRKPKLRDE